MGDLIPSYKYHCSDFVAVFILADAALTKV